MPAAPPSHSSAPMTASMKSSSGRADRSTGRGSASILEKRWLAILARKIA
jgi:hypothetical protein